MNTTARTRVKICGVTSRADAEAAIEAGADALGFNLWPGSKRYVELDSAASWIGDLPPFVTRVAVMVNPRLLEVQSVLASPCIDLVQLHGHEDEAFCASVARFGRRFVKAIALRDSASLRDAGRYSTREFLLDAFVPGAFGGTGTKINLELAAGFIASHPGLHVILSGGLTPENVAEAIRRTRPIAVDVASGVEVTGDPRRKDRAKLRAFLAAAQSASSPGSRGEGE